MPRVKKKKLTRRDTKNTYTPSENMSMEDIQRILDAQGGFPLEAAEVYSDSGPRKMNQQELMKALGGYGLETARWLPFVDKALEAGDIASAVKTGKDLSGNKATPEELAAISAVTALIPNFIKKPTEALFKALKSPFVKKQVKEGLELLSKNNNISNKNLKSLYRVVDAPDIETAKKYATHIKLDDAEGAIAGQMRGRRTDIQEHVQKTTGFDHLNTTTDQSWILGKRSKAKGDNLVDRYGGKNPYVAKLKYNPDQQKYVDILPPDITSEQFKYLNTLPNITDDALAKIKPGTSTNLGKYIIGGQKRNITGLLGPKGSKVAEIEEILPISEYIERHNKNPNFKWDKGGKTPKIKRYQDGGDVDDLLKMLKEYKGAPEDKEVLSSLVSESTQPSGYTQPVLPEENKINLIDKPAQITQAPDEVKKADWSTMFANPMQMLKYTGKYGMTRPTKAELDAQKSNIYDSITSMFNPSAYVEALKHMDTSLDAADQALLQGFKDGRLSPKDLSNVVGNLSDAGLQALFLSMAPMASRTILSGVKGAFRQPTYAGSPSTTPLQQLAGTQEALPAAKVKAPKVKKKKYEPVSAYEESNVAVSTPELPASRELLAYVPELALSNVPGIPEPLKTLDDQIAFLEKMMGMIESRTSLMERAKSTEYNNYSDAWVRAKEIKQKAIASSNPGVYQYPSFMTGSKLEKQVSSKDGTIARSALEQLVKNKNTKASEAIAVKDVLSEFEGKRIPYENFKQSLALDIRSAEIIPTDVYSKAGVAELSGSRKWKYNIIPKTKLYKDASLGLTKEGESHFKDTPHSFWIRSFPYENSLRILEWQTDLKVLKDPLWNPTTPGLSSITSIIKNNPQWTDGSTSGYVVPDNFLEYQISFLKRVKEKIQTLQQKEGDWFVESRRNMIKDINEALILAKAEQKRVLDANPLKETIIAKSKGLPLKFLNESLLDAARQGKKYLDVPTAETMFTIEGWTKPNNAKLDPLYEEQSDIVKRYDTNYPHISSYSIDETNEIRQAINNVERGYGRAGARDGVEALIKSTIKEKERIYDQLINSTKRGNPVTLGTIRKLNKGSDFENAYIDYLASVVTNNGFKDPNQPKHIASKKKIIDYIKKAKSEDVKRAQEDIIKFKENHLKIDDIESRPFDIKDIGGENPTVEQKKKMAEFYSLTEDYRNTPKLFKSTFGTDAIPFTDKFGNTYNRVVVPEKFFQTDPSKPLEIKTYKKGGLLNKLVKKYQDGGGIFKKLRERRANRRIEKTPVRDASSQEVLEMLSSYGADSPMMQGEYDPREKEIVMYKDDSDTLKHEQVHAAQYGPLQRLAKRMNDERSAPIQDPTKRKVYRKLSENISPEAYAAFNRAGKLILDKGEEFEAVLDTGVNAAKEKGVNFNASFEEILSQLKNIPSPTNNMRGLMKFMSNKFTKEQRDLILKSIR